MPTDSPRAQFTGCALGGVWEISGNEAFERFSPFRPRSLSPPPSLHRDVPGEMRCVFHINKTLMFADHSVLDKMAHWRLPAAFENEQDKYYSPH